MGPVQETIGQRLRRLRLERGLSQRELSGPGVSYAYISRIEAGERRPSVKALRVLALNLGVSADYLETGSDIRAEEERELRLADAELELRLAEDEGEVSTKLEAILDEAQRAGDVASATRARLALGLAEATADRHEEAVARLEQALADTPLPPHFRPDVYATLGRSYAALGRHDEAIALFEKSLEGVSRQAPEDSATYVRFATYLSYALTDSGQVERAEGVMKSALARLGTSADPYTRVRIYWSLARLAEVEGRAAEALDYIRRAIALLEATDDTLHLARAHLMCAIIMISDGVADEALEHLTLSESLFGRSPEPVDVGMVRIAQSRCATLQSDGDRAADLARAALAAFGEHHAGDQGEAWLALGDALSLTGSVTDAESAYVRAIELLGSHGRTRELAEAKQRLEQLLAGPGRSGEAQDVLAHDDTAP